jgi:uncharacterized protein YndB with AHSA1/START domain
MVEFSAAIDIAATPETVWRVMTDISREPEWMPAVRASAFIGEPQGYAVGARMRRAARFLWIDMSWESEIVRCEPDSVVVFKHVGGALKGESRWRVTPTEGGCTVVLESEGPAPGPLAWFPALAAAGGRAGLRRDLGRLKRLAEGLSRKGQPAHG